MKIKTKNTVFFTNKLTVEQEYKIVNSKQTDKRKDVLQRIPGEGIFTARTDEVNLYKTNFIYNEEDEKVFNIFMCISKIPVFYDFIIDFVERCEDIECFPILERISKFLSIMINKTEESDITTFLPETEKTTYAEIYSDFIKSIHDELISGYVFEEDTWNVVGKENLSKKKAIFSEYTPISDIFIGKVYGGTSQLGGPDFDKLTLDFEGLKTTDKVISALIKSENCKITSTPYILTVVIKDASRTNILENNDILVNNTLYTLNSFVTETDFGPHCYVKSSDSWIQYNRSGVENIFNITLSVGHPVIMFYCKK